MTTVSHAVPCATSPNARSARRAHRQGLGISYNVLEPIVASTDCAIIVGASVIGEAAYRLTLNAPIGLITPYAGLGLVGSLAYALAAHRCELYRFNGTPRRRHYVRVASCWLWAVLVISVVLFLMKSGAEISRGSILCFAALGAVGLLSWRATVLHWLKSAITHGSIRGRPIILLGTETELASYGPRELLTSYGLDEIVRLRLPNVMSEHPDSLAATVSEVLEHCRKGAAREIVLALPWKDDRPLELMLEQLRLTPLPVRLLPDHAVQAILKDRCWSTSHAPLVEVQRPPLTTSERICKRSLDLLIASFVLAALLPFMALIAVAIRVGSRGPAFFQQRRKGFNGKEFVIYKFRTMTVMENGSRVTQARRSDERVTRLGRFLRLTSIDELPQLYNVLRGDMSLVGPRPHAVAHDQEYSRAIANYAYRHHVKPGISGWAQVNGFRGGTPRLEQMAQRIELDLWYINNWSLTLDLRILLRTLIELVRPRNAY